MNIQQISDAIVAKSAALDELLSKNEPTMDEVKTAKELNNEIEELTAQRDELKSLETIKAKNATRATEVKTVVNALPKSTEVKVGDTVAKSSMSETEYKSYVTGLFLHGLSSETSRQKYTDVTGVAYKEHTQSNDATGGIFVPTETSSLIVNLKDSYGVFRRNSNVQSMGSESLRIFRTGDDVTAYWGSELGTATASDMSFDAVTLTAKKLYGYSILSEELAMNSSQNLGLYFAQSVARQFAKKEDEAGFVGDGTSSYGGILGLYGKLNKTLTDGGGTWTNDTHKGYLGSAQVVTGNTFAEVTIPDLIKGVRKVPTYALAGAKWYINKVAFGDTIERLAYNAGGVTAAELASSFGQRAFGYPVEFVDVMPSTDANSQVFAWFGNLALASTFGDRMAVSIKQDASLGFKEDAIHIKATQFVDIAVHEMGNYNATASSRVTGPIVGFVTLNA